VRWQIGAGEALDASGADCAYSLEELAWNVGFSQGYFSQAVGWLMGCKGQGRVGNGMVIEVDGQTCGGAVEKIHGKAWNYVHVMGG
jgi:hypothetical protein